MSSFPVPSVFFRFGPVCFNATFAVFRVRKWSRSTDPPFRQLKDFTVIYLKVFYWFLFSSKDLRLHWLNRQLGCHVDGKNTTINTNYLLQLINIHIYMYYVLQLINNCMIYIIVRNGHGGGWSRKINAWHLYTLMVYL